MNSLYSSLAACSLAITFLVPSAFAQLPDVDSFTSTAAKSAIKKFEASQSKLTGFYSRAKADMAKKYQDEMKRFKATLLEELEEARKTATLADELDEAIKIRDAIAKVEAIAVSPGDHAVEPPAAPSKTITELQQQISNLEKELAKSKAELAKAANTLTLPNLFSAVAGTWISDNGSIWTFTADGRIRAVTRSGQPDSFWRGSYAFASGQIVVVSEVAGAGYRYLEYPAATTILRDSPNERFVLKKRTTR